MSGHIALSVNQLIAEACPNYGIRETTLNSNRNQQGRLSFSPAKDDEEEERAAPVSEKAPCRICREEDDIKQLIAPCSCNGSIKMVHEACLARWCREKRSTMCEVCQKPYNAECAITSALTPPVLPPLPPSLDEIARTIRTEPASANAILAEVYSRELFGGVDECATFEGTRNCIIRILVLFPLIFYLLNLSRESLDYSDHSFMNQFSILCVNVVTFLTPVYMVLYGVHLYFRYWERKAENFVRYRIANMIYEENVRRYQEMVGAAGATVVGGVGEP